MIAALILQAATLGATNHAVDAPMTTPHRAPTFADDFSGRTVDPAKWRFDVSRNKTGWPNNELQYYRHRDAAVRDGHVVLEARRETPRAADWGGQRYTSVKLVTRRALGFGFYEVRAKLPCGRGIWPAIWMLPASGQWPDEGEIDIMEMVGFDPNVIHATLHTGAFNHQLGTQRGAQKRVATACTEFHRYQLDWQPHAITIGVDDRAYFRVRDDQPGGKAAWPFTRPYQLILNVAVGGDWGGKQGVDDTRFPQAMAVDYVRYWAAK